jgi:hypothetical protein
METPREIATAQTSGFAGRSHGFNGHKSYSILSRRDLSFLKIQKVTLRNASSFISLVFLLTGACIANFGTSGAQDAISFVGEVRWISIERGFFGLVAEDGKKFFPLNLPQEFKKEGLRVRVKGNIKKGVATVQMWGAPFEIHEIVEER